MEITLTEKPFDFSTLEYIDVLHEGVEYKAEVSIQDTGEDDVDISVEVLSHGLNPDLRLAIITGIEDKFKNYKIKREI